MPFINQIISFIDNELRSGSLNKEKLQPALFHGLSTTVARKKPGSTDLEVMPGIVTANGIGSVITPDDKYAIQIYHKLNGNLYSLEKKSVGDTHFIRSTSDLSMIVITNSKMTGKAKEAIEPVALFGMPQKLSTALLTDLLINSCLITPVASIMDQNALFRQEYPQSKYFLNENVSLFSIKYKIEMTFSQICVDKCLCD